ncbi:MmcQ/YjbR family DNA-binding protein [Cellulomonas sp. McL0617]|uniref:MmcQ/YjbR family DNA-binding protein n=1 Tax=Cellulomonas sp. McL0617 TaxID=3415675 RepID=UPI003CE6B73A
MATFEDVAAAALALPETTQEGHVWSVRGKVVVKARGLRPADLKALGDAVPEGPVLMVHTGTLVAKDELLARRPDAYFVTPHFHGYPAVLVRLDVIDVEELTDVIVEAWLLATPKTVGARWLAEHPDGP